jgi:hypothetical protein
MNWNNLLSHITAMVEAAHPKPIAPTTEPRRYARALLSLNVNGFEYAEAVELSPGSSQDKSLRVNIRSGTARLQLTQMGNIPIVITSVNKQGYCLMHGPALGFQFDDAKVGDEIIVSLKALDWARY